MPKSLLRLPTILAFAIYAVYSCVLVALYHYFSADLVLMNTLWFDVVDLLMQWVEIFGIAVLFGILIAAVYRFGIAPCRPLFLSLGGALLFKYVAAILSLSVVYGSLDLTYDYSSYLVSLLVELGLGVLMIYLCHKHATNRAERDRVTRNAAHFLGVETEEAAALIPFSSYFDRRNLVQRGVMIGMGVFTLLRLAAFILSDIAYSMMGALFTAADIPVMLVYWALQIFIPCFLGYLLVIFTVNRFHRFFEAKTA